jgi:predicted class III extradiol MEMO1 family dioxygenase
MLTVALPTLFEVCRAYGGLPERVIARGVLVAFPRRHVDDHPQEHAVRAALALLARLGGDATHANPVAIGIANEENLVASEQLAISLGSANRDLGTDLLVAASAFLDIRTGFYADRILTKDERTGRTTIDAFAVKGAVSV